MQAHVKLTTGPIPSRASGVALSHSRTLLKTCCSAASMYCTSGPNPPRRKSQVLPLESGDGRIRPRRSATSCRWLSPSAGGQQWGGCKVAPAAGVVRHQLSPVTVATTAAAPLLRYAMRASCAVVAPARCERPRSLGTAWPHSAALTDAVGPGAVQCEHQWSRVGGPVARGHIQHAILLAQHWGCDHHAERRERLWKGAGLIT